MLDVKTTKKGDLMVNVYLHEENQQKQECEPRSELELTQKKGNDLGNSFAQNLPLDCLDWIKELVEWRRFELPSGGKISSSLTSKYLLVRALLRNYIIPNGQLFVTYFWSLPCCLAS